MLSILQQLGEVLDGADHLRNVGVLVVVPGNDLNLGHAAGQLVDHGLGGMTQVQVVSWYDNENSYVSQMVRTIKHFSTLL